jgi:hypothetical protein
VRLLFTSNIITIVDIEITSIIATRASQSCSDFFDANPYAVSKYVSNSKGHIEKAKTTKPVLKESDLIAAASEAYSTSRCRNAGIIVISIPDTRRTVNIDFTTKCSD